MRGKVTDDGADLDREKVDGPSATKAIAEWFKIANVRQMHTPALGPAGKGVDLEFLPDGPYLTSKVINPLAVRYVDEGVYTGYSIGIKDGRKTYGDPTAPKGRWVDFSVPEVSLVDRPANPRSIISVLKAAGMSDDGDDDEKDDDEDKPFGGKQAPPFGSEEADKAALPGSMPDAHPHTQHLDHMHAHGGLAPHSHDHFHLSHNPAHDGGEHPHAVPAGRVPMASYGKLLSALIAAKAAVSTADQNDLPDSDFAYIEPGGEKDAGGKTTPRSKRHFPIMDAAHVRNTLARANQSPFGDQAMPKIRSAAKKFGIDVSDDGKFAGYSGAWKYLHDLCCPAYDPARLGLVYPEVQKDGVAGALGPSARSLLYQMLLTEVMEDGGSGQAALDIHHIATAYGKLACFLSDETTPGHEQMEAAGLYAARADLFKAFKAANGMESIPDGATDTRLPSPSEPPPASRFRRPRIDAGQYRENATGSDSGARLPSAHPDSPNDHDRAALTAGEARQSPGNSATLKAEKFAHDLLDTHDWLASLNPGSCPLEINRQLDERADSVPTRTTSTAPQGTAVKMDEPDSVKLLVDDAVKAALAPYQETVANLQAEIDRLGSQPDPYRAPLRGMAGLPPMTHDEPTYDATKLAEAEAQKRAQRADLEHDLDYYQGLLDGGDLHYRDVALRGIDKTREKIAAL